MQHRDLVIRGRRVVLSATTKPASIHVRDGRITDIREFDELIPDAELIEAGDDEVVMPGLVDTHVHVNEPGRTEWEGFSTATKAAAAGGVTTIIDMPLNSIPPTTTVAGFNEKLNAARDKCHVDVGFWGGVVPGNRHELEALFAAGVVGFKCFLIDSGVKEFPNVTEGYLREIMPVLKELDAVLIVHAELPGPIVQAAQALATDQSNNEERRERYETFLQSRPRAAENEAVELMIKLAREFKTRVHIVHHSSADVLPALRNAIAAGVRMTVETCPHYLFFAAEEIPDGATEFKCCPPIRERENREQLWQALGEGTISMVVSDHSPCSVELKLQEKGDFIEAWGGISSIQYRLPVMWTTARRREYGFNELARWLCESPAKLVALDKRKGSIAIGCDADIVIWKPEEQFVVEPAMTEHRHKLTPYTGQRLSGKVEKTFLRGKKIYDDGQFASTPQGELLKDEG